MSILQQIVNPSLFNGAIKADILQNKTSSNISNQDHYLVDSGDSLYINFKDINIFSRSYNVDVNGQIFLPEIGFFSVKRKTIREIKSQLIENYKKVIINPIIEVTIFRYRPLSIYISGEVNRPGLYKLEYKNINNELDSSPTLNNYSFLGNQENYINSFLKNTDSSSFNAPRIFDALQKVDGLTNKADLSNISVTRLNSNELGGGKIKANINMLTLLKNGDQSQNIRLFDGDHIYVPANENILLDQIIDINRTNLNAKEFQVFISGNIVKPGRTILKQNSSLLEGIMAAGGIKASTGNIEFIRLKRNGKSEKRIFRFDDLAKKGSYKNPILINGDLIIVNKNLIGKTSSIISELGSPIINSYGLYSIFN